MAAQQLSTKASAQAHSSAARPVVHKMIGPFSQNMDLRKLPKIPPTHRAYRAPLMLHSSQTKRGGSSSGHRAAQKGQSGSASGAARSASSKDQTGGQRPRSHGSSGSGSGSSPAAPSNMASPSGTFAGINANASGCGCLPPDTDGDVGPNDYIQSVNSSIKIFDKSGNALAGPITYNSFFQAMGTGTACGNSLNDGDGVVQYDHIHDRWMVSDFAFPSSGGPTYQCIGISKTSDPVSGGWYLYAVVVDSTNNTSTLFGDYPKFGLWSDGLYFSINLWTNQGSSAVFNGVRAYALDLNSMVNGGSANAISFTIAPADLGDQYSLLPATYRTGDPPPAGQPEWFMDINSSSTAGTTENQVFVRRFHADFATPANSTFGVGAGHTPDGTIGVNGFVDAFTSSTENLVPNGTSTTSQWIDTLGDKLMYPLVYQNLNGVESIYADDTVNNTGPTAIRWYQFDMTGNTIPATPTQQQTYNGNGDGLYRDMPSLNVDNQGDLALNFTVSSTTLDPGIRYAGRTPSDPPNTLGQGEAVLQAGTGHQTSTSGRWGDYSSTFVDPSNTCTFYATNEYYSATGSSSWNTRVGMFRFPGCTDAALTLPSQTPPVASCTYPSTGSAPVSAGPVTVTATGGTTGPTDYATLQAAFAAINAGTHTGDITVWLLGDTTETASAVLNASGSGSASYTSVQVVPSGARTTSGSLAAPLVDLNGAKCVKIDGLNSGGNSLTLSNTSTSSTAGTSTIRFTAGAQNDTVTRSTILGSSTTTLASVAGGTIVFNTTTASGTNLVGNSNDTVSNNNIGPAGANLPNKAIFGLGTVGNNTVNRGDTIDSNNIYDFFNAAASTSGIYLAAGNTDWTISNNRIYQTAPRTFTGTALRYAGITVNGTTTSATGNWHTITGNVIGFGASDGTGTTTISGNDNEIHGIDIQAASSLTATRVQGNTISGITQTSSRNSTTTGLPVFAGIATTTSAGASATGIVDILGNTIGSLDGSSSIVINASSTTTNTVPVMGILTFSAQSDTTSGNNIGAITIQGTGTVTGFRGIFAGATATQTQTVANNTIGGSGAGGAITDSQVGAGVVYGIQTATSAASITGNTIRNLNDNGNVASSVVVEGIAMSSTSATFPSNVSRNTVYGLSNASGSASNSIYAIDLTMSVTSAVNGNLVERNVIHSLSLTSTDNTSQTWGIVVRGPATSGNVATSTVQNNMIRLGIDSSGNSVTSGLSIIGIRDIAATGGSTANSYYDNSVYIGGSGVASSSNTYAFNSGTITTTRKFQDNIFWNARSNASGAGKNYAIAVGGTAANPAGLTSNFNDLGATGTGGVLGVFNAVDQATLANWRTATGLDASSISADPLFANATGSASTFDLHLQNTSPARVAGTPVATSVAAPLTGVTDDVDSDARPASTPDIGADQTPVTATSLAAGSASGQYGATAVLTATLTATSGGGSVVGRTVNFTLNGSSVGSATTNASGVATLNNASLSGIAIGSYPSGVSASFAGDAGYVTSSNTASLTVTMGDQTISVSQHAPATAAVDDQFTVAATGGGSGNAIVYGSSGSCTNTGATYTVTNPGTCTVTYDQAGDSNYNAAPEVSESVNTVKANQTIHVSTHAPSSAVFGTGFTVAATGGNSGNPVTYGSSGGCTNTGADFTMTSGSTDCTVTYDQAGSSNYNDATEVTETVTAQKAAQAISIGTHAPASAVYGTGFTVGATGGASGNAVTYGSSGGCSNTGADFTMTSGSTDCTVTYDQAGDSNYSAAPQQTDTVTAQKAAQAISIGTHAPASAVYGTGFTVGATGGGSGNAVTYGSSGGCSNTGADFTMTSGSTDCTVTYDQAGDSNYSAAPQQTDTVTATKADQTIHVTTGAPSSAAYNSSFDFTADAPGGDVSYSSDGGCSNVGAHFTMTSGTVTCSFTLSQAGDGNYKPATDVTGTVDATKLSQSILITQHAPDTAQVGDHFTVAATGDASGNPVVYGSSGDCTNSGADYTVTGAGTCTVTYDQAGDDNYKAAPELTDTVNSSKADQTIHVDTHAPSSAVYGTGFTVAATGGDSGEPIIYGSLGACTNVGADFTMTSGGGTCTVTYDQPGDANYNAATQVTETVTAEKADQTITFPNPGAHTYGNPNFDPGASASSGNAVAYGASGACSMVSGMLHLTGAGTCTVTADQSGDVNYNAAAQVQRTFAVGKAALSITADDRQKFFAETLTLGTNQFVSSGLVGSDSLSGVTLSSSGAAAAATPGSYAIVASSAVAGGSTNLANYTITYHTGSLVVTPVGIIGLNGVLVTATGGKIDSFNSTHGVYGSSNHASGAYVLGNGAMSLAGVSLLGSLGSATSTVSVAHSASVSGNVVAGTTASILGTVGGTVTQHSPGPPFSATVSACKPLSGKAGISGGTFTYASGNLTVKKGTVKLASKTYCFHNVTVNKGATLSVTGPVTINLTGKLAAKGQIVSTTKLPGKLSIKSSFVGGTGVSIVGGAHAAMTIVAPKTTATVAGGSFFGSLLAGTVKLTGGIQFHADQH
jgi:hypothetical protein